MRREYVKADKCGRGHAMRGDNVGYRKSGKLEGQRFCIACRDARVREFRERKRAA